MSGPPTRIILRGMFGKPTLQWLKNNGTESNGRAEWSREWRRYGQWTAKLSPGVQTDDDYGSVSWDVNGMRLADLQQISYVYRMGATEVVAPNVVIHVYDPNDIDNRADISMSHSESTLVKTSGWRKFDLTTAIDACFYYGNNIPTTTGLTQCDGTSATNYTLAEFQADAVFKDYVIGKITIEYGYYSTGYLSPAHICKVEVRHEGKIVDLELEPSLEEQLDTARDDQAKAFTTIPTWTFGKPTLMSNNNSKATWFKSGTSPYYQKSATSWLAELYGGAQTGDDWAGVFIPVNEMPIPDFTAAMWSYYMSASDSFGCNMVVWVHDPTDFDKRAEITQRQQHASLEKTAGWNAHELDTSVTQFFYYGEGVSGTDNIAAAGTDYTWAQYQGDAMFSGWTIYRISFEFGWQQAGTFGTAWVADIKLNGTLIPMGPADGKHDKTVLTTKTVVGGANAADDVISESVDAGADWDFEFGGTGYITKAIIASATNAITPRLNLQLYTKPPTCNLHDNVASSGPLAADLPYFIGTIELSAMSDDGTSHSYTIATPSTVGKLPLMFDTPKLYGVLVSKDACTPGAVLWSIILSADMED